MKNSNYIFLALVFVFGIMQEGVAQNGTVEAVNGVIVGNNSGTTDGTIRYTGADFEGRKMGSWTSLTGAGGASMWSQNGSMIFYNTDNVGVGTNDPQTKFHIEGSNEILRLSGNSPWIGFRETGESFYGYNWMTGTTFNMGVSGLNNLGFRINNVERMRITSDGDMGIGTSSPSAKLHIKNTGEGLRIDSNIPKITFYNEGAHKGSIFHNSGELNISNQEADNIKFRISGTTPVTINSTGNVGIGTTVPAAKLDVRGSAVFNENGADVDFRVESDDDENVIFVKSSIDWVGIGTSSPQAKLHVDGNIKFGSQEEIGDGGSNQIYVHGDFRPKYNDEYDNGTSTYKWKNIWATNGTIQTSDRRLKNNIKDMSYGIEEIMKLRPVKFRWNNDESGEEKLGLIAQELLPIIKEVVKTHHYESSEIEGESRKRVENERMGVYYSDLIPVLIKGMQEQQEQIEFLKDEIKKLKKG